MTASRPTLEDVERLARMTGLSIDPAHLPGVQRNLDVLLDQAALVLQPPIDPIVEPAALFHP